MESSRFKSVCVFCGSSAGKRESYREAALELGQEMQQRMLLNLATKNVAKFSDTHITIGLVTDALVVTRKMDLVYGGGSIGLMGLVSQAVHLGGGKVLGIIPRTLMSKELTGVTVGEVKPVSDMHQRKAEMARNSDCFIALPGGYGTLEELLEVISWAQLGIHDKPVGLLNVDGFYDFLLTFIDKAVDDGFIKPYQRHIFVSAPNAKELLQKLEECVPVKDEVVAKLNWEVESQPQIGFSPLTAEIIL